MNTVVGRWVLDEPAEVNKVVLLFRGGRAENN